MKVKMNEIEIVTKVEDKEENDQLLLFVQEPIRKKVKVRKGRGSKERGRYDLYSGKEKFSK
jgi:hypothetical protein